MSALPSTTIPDEYLNEQLINCLNVQTNVIQNLAQYSQHISLQLIEIKNNVNILANRIFILQQQQQESLPPPPPPPSNSLLYLLPAWQIGNKPSVPFSFTTTADQEPSRTAPFVFDSISSNHVNYSDEDEDDEDEDEDDDADEDGSPIPLDFMGNVLPSEMNPGDQNEKILFSERAKLYHFDPSINQLKERGNGELMILQQKSTNLSRILMFQDEELDHCANHPITPQLELKPHQNIPHAYVWSVLDFGTGEARYETFCVKFKTDEDGKQFVRRFNECKEHLPSIGRISLNDDDPIPFDQLQAIAEQIERGQKFHSYEHRTHSKSSQDTPSTNENLRENFSSYFPSDFFSQSNPMKSLDSSSTSRGLNWSSDETTDSHPSPPKPQRQIIKAKRSLPSNRPPPPVVSSSYQPAPQVSQNDEISTVQTHQKKSRNFSANQSMDSYAVKMVENILHEVKDELHKQTAIVTIEDENSKSSDAGFPFANYGTTTDFQFSSKMPLTFANFPKLNFADFTRQSSSSSDQSGERVFPGQGSSLFEENTNEDDYEPPIQFKPIVHLETVVVKTGEEEENILFRERAKLYRFDPSTNEFKERGIGELKILQHQTSNRCRIVMRRDQVFKVCANHRLNDEMELKHHPEKANAYIWSAMDSSDGTLKDEILYVKFKTSDIAERFFEEFNRAKHFK